MKRFVLASVFVLVNVAPARAQSFTLAPSFSFGYGIVDGAHDHIRDEPTVLQRICALEWPSIATPFHSFVSARPSACLRTKRAPFAAYGGLGVTLVGTLTPRLAFASALDLTVGSTHRRDMQSSAGGVGYSNERTEGEYPAMTYELAYRLGATGRVRLGGSRRGYLGTGIRVGYRMQVGEFDERLVPRNPFPDASPYTFSPAPRGFTAEALLEGGFTLGEAHPVSFGVLVGAGRPRLRAELVMSFPIAIGAQ